ncbi:MAG: hypothetical protein LUH23_05700 [Oscillospiraceae bacterium]|nr:hypothetical protein [Oscillospiraceae bacterium]
MVEDESVVEYPNEFYRGLSSSNCITDEGFVTAAAFLFRENKERDEDLLELSINWNDDEGALYNLGSRHKVGCEDRQFKAGYCVVNRVYMEQYMNCYIKTGKMKYERRPEEAREDNEYQDNRYHGNLLMPKGIDSNLKKNIQYALATLAQMSHSWDDFDIQ